MMGGLPAAEFLPDSLVTWEQWVGWKTRGATGRQRRCRSIRLITQTVNEFFQWPEAEMILDQCAIKQFHKLGGMDDEWANESGLNYAQMRYVQDAIPGDGQEGYSQALLGVDSEWYGMEIQALPKEKQVIDFDPTEDTSDVSALVETEMESDAAKETAEGVPLPDGSAE